MTNIIHFNDNFQKLDCRNSKFIFTDSEFTKWVNINPNHEGFQTHFLIKTFLITDASQNILEQFMIWDSKFPPPTEIPTGYKLIVGDCNQIGLEEVCDVSKDNYLYFFFSTKDVEAVVKPETWYHNLLDPSCNISRKRNTNGMVKTSKSTYRLRDTMGMFNTSLDKGMELVGIPSHKNDVADIDMSQFHKAMEKDPDKCAHYAAMDVINFRKMILLRVKQINEINEAVHPGIEPFTFTNIPRSSGSLIWETFLRWLLLRKPRLYKACLRLSDSNSNKSWFLLKTVNKELDKIPDFEMVGDENHINLVTQLKKATQRFKDDAIVNGFGMGSIKNYLLLSRNTGLLGAMVQGGRCNNEVPTDNPYDQFISDVIDPDLQGCYGTKLREFDYPCGIPSIYEVAKDDEPETLGKVLNDLESDLLDGLYTIVVHGDLNFEQDLVHSKMGVTTKSIISTMINGFNQETVDYDVWGNDIEAAHVGGDLKLLSSEIVNGIITSKTLEVIRKVSNNQEFSQWMNLKVDCVVYYPKSLEVSESEFIKTCENPKSRGGKFAKKGDIRTRVWTRLPLDEFVGGYIDKRLEWKRLSKDSRVDENDRKIYGLKQNAAKIFINTLYGDLCAPYFPLGNTVVANNITSDARIGVWMMSKTMLNVQTITDGGLCSNNYVYLDGRWKPGFNTMANRERYLKHRSVKVARLIEVDHFLDWVRDKNYRDGKTNAQIMDDLIHQRICEFWANYELTFDFQIETKVENCSQYAVYLNSGDYYCFDLDANGVDIPVVMKCRGVSKRDKNHPKLQFLKHLANPELHPIPDPTHVTKRLLGVGEFLKNHKDGELPHDEIEQPVTHKQGLNPRMMATEDEYRKYRQAKDRATRRYDKIVSENPKQLFGLVKDISKEKYPVSRPWEITIKEVMEMEGEMVEVR